MGVRIIVLMPILLASSSLCGQSEVYLGEYQFNAPRLYRISDDGNFVEELFIIPSEDWLVVGLQVDLDNGKIYWVHGSFNEGRIRRANLDGSGQELLLSGLTNPRGLALDVDGGKMYWSDTQDNSMYRADLDGSNLEPIIDTGDQLGRPTLDLDSGLIYFGNFGAGDIRVANLDGSNSQILFGGLFTPVAIALDLDQAKIYWADSNTSAVSNHIARANFDGTDMEILYAGEPGSSGFTGIGLDLVNQKLYWSDEIAASEKGLWEANLDGSDADRIFESPMGWNAGAMTLGGIVIGDTFLLRGDADNNGAFNGLLDSIYILSHQFQGGPAPDCLEAADVDGNGAFNGLIDGLYSLQHAFQGGPPPPLPYPTCGPDPEQSESLGCNFSFCI